MSTNAPLPTATSTNAPFPAVELARLTDREAARIRLYCVPPSGVGSSFYRPWLGELSDLFDLVAVDLPGRGARSGEPSITDIGWAAESIAKAIAGDLRSRPPADGFHAVFGHSFGALLAHEATDRLRSVWGAEPDLLAVSAVPPPSARASATTSRATWAPESPRSPRSWAGSSRRTTRSRSHGSSTHRSWRTRWHCCNTPRSTSRRCARR
ncbi:thioesterase II family protein [Streptomyces sp. TS71-3]|uniref:thioesterase II family protein n=1 Tax=Streptomyces sp. TS71-3 TaxID=2733862 RepID=UPI001BB3BC28|nr:alpha/beta fold hydrolase [Streptomyces sp. TS71-3]